MKNILAENMLRFGVKNLSKSDVKKINESSLLTEGFKGQDGITYQLDFKDQAAFDTYYTDFGISTNGMATPPWVSKIPKDSDQRGAAMVNWSKERFNLMKCIMLGMAHQGYVPGWLASLKYTEVLGILKAAGPFMYKAYGPGRDPSFSDGLNDFEARAKDWQKMITPDPAKPAIKISYWEHFRNMHLAPLVTAKKALVIPKVKPVNPDATKPGVKPVTKTTSPSVKPVTTN